MNRFCFGRNDPSRWLGVRTSWSLRPGRECEGHLAASLGMVHMSVIPGVRGFPVHMMIKLFRFRAVKTGD